MKKSTLIFLMLLILVFAISISRNCNAIECESYDYEDEYEEEVWDPLEPINQITFRFNDFVYDKVMNPVSDIYVFIMPGPIRTGISNLMHNLVAPKRFVGAVMQLKFKVAMIEFRKFIINSTVGIIGIRNIDIIKIDDEEDVGQGFAYWGVPSGPYIVWPFLGSSNLRDSVGMIGEFYLYPASYAENLIQMTARSSDAINEWPVVSDGYNTITEGAVDPYAAMRDVYEQYRDEKISK